MALDKHVKQELLVRSTFRKYWYDKLSTTKQKAMVLPGVEIPRGGNLDLVSGPKSGTVLCLFQRSDYVAAYKHTIGHLIGSLVHYGEMNERELRELVRAAQVHPDYAELMKGAVDDVKLSKRLFADLKSGELIISLITELPEVPQQARELEANFFPIAQLLQTWLPSPVKKKKLCTEVLFFAINLNVEPAAIAPLSEALKPLLKAAS